MGAAKRMLGAAVVLAAAVYLLVEYTPVGLLLLPLQQNPGPFDRARMSAVVERVRKAGIKPGEHREFVLNGWLDPTSLKAIRSEGSAPIGRGAGRAWAEVAASGALTVVIETRDLGHAGEYGFAYSDEPLTPQPISENWYRLDVPGPVNQVTQRMKIDAHWWSVENGLN